MNLSFSNTGDSGAGFLSDAIKVNTALTDVDLRGNRIGDSGVVKVVITRNMTELNIQYSLIPEESLLPCLSKS